MNRFQFVAGHQRRHGVKRLSTILGIARSSYYHWRRTAKDRAARQAADARLAVPIRAVHLEPDGTHEVPRITAELRETGDEAVNHKRVARIMRASGLAGARLRRRHRTTIPDPAAARAPDLTGHDLTAAEPNTKYVGDITYLPLDGGKVCYLATVIDLPSRRPAGWADRRPHARGPRHRRPARADPHPWQPRRIDHAHRPRSPGHEQDIRPGLQVSTGSAKHEHDRQLGRQRTRRVPQRDPQTRDPAKD
ncbi:IS3 family transposase [Streptomyces tendae]|uniref:IS3 family transposase n=1 Tax=Streptomyces tendae TaxID=1932 RepID=UPI0036B51B96